MNNREKLIDLMFDNKLDRHELAELVMVDRETVDHWLVTPESARHIEVPDMAIALLGFKLCDQAAVVSHGEAQEPNEF